VRPGGEGIGGNGCRRDAVDVIGTLALVEADDESAPQDDLRPRDRGAHCACGPAAGGATGRILTYQNINGDGMPIKVHCQSFVNAERVELWKC
jgi:hypothetical protein